MSKKITSDPRVSEIFRGESGATRLLAAMVASMLSQDALDALIADHADVGPDMRAHVAGKPFSHWYGQSPEDLKRSNLTPEQIKEIEAAHKDRNIPFGVKPKDQPKVRTAEVSPAAKDEARQRLQRGDGAAIGQVDGTAAPAGSPEGNVLTRGDGSEYVPESDTESGTPVGVRGRVAATLTNETAADGEKFAGRPLSAYVRNGELLTDDAMLEMEHVGPATVKAIKAAHKKAGK